MTPNTPAEYCRSNPHQSSPKCLLAAASGRNWHSVRGVSFGREKRPSGVTIGGEFTGKDWIDACRRADEHGKRILGCGRLSLTRSSGWRGGSARKRCTGQVAHNSRHWCSCRPEHKAIFGAIEGAVLVPAHPVQQGAGWVGIGCELRDRRAVLRVGGGGGLDARPVDLQAGEGVAAGVNAKTK